MIQAVTKSTCSALTHLAEMTSLVDERVVSSDGTEVMTRPLHTRLQSSHADVEVQAVTGVKDLSET